MSAIRKGLYSDVSGVTFTYTPPTGGSQVILHLFEIEDIECEPRGTPLMWSGDAAPGPTAKKLTNQVREGRLVGADISTLNSIPPGVFGTLVWTENDFNNGVSVGACTYTLLNCSFDGNSWGGKKNEIKKATVPFSAIWAFNRTTGVYTDPLSYVEANS